ncbi:hypothetical protein [Methylobacter psychrophilus]|uniref:hypothetical protein n=1 Tax=Methylobacter psychrophilus TaxID=96941 RepID=UPI0021D51B5C|nr:hypothetical protein [Methylobacter psychrophilus]
MRDAPFYIGMNKNLFNAEVRPLLTEMTIGDTGIAFDRLELEAWVDDLKSRSSKPGTRKLEKTSWDAKKHLGSLKGASSGTSTKSSKVDAFAKALAQVTKKKPKASSRT